MASASTTAPYLGTQFSITFSNLNVGLPDTVLFQSGGWSDTVTVAGSTATNKTLNYTLPYTLAQYFSGKTQPVTVRITHQSGKVESLNLSAQILPTAISSATGATVGVSNGQTIKFRAPSTSLRYAVKFTITDDFGNTQSFWGTGSGYVDPTTTTSDTTVTSTIPSSWAGYIIKSKTKSATVALYTYTRTNTQIGYKTKTITITVDNTYRPVANILSISGQVSTFGNTPMYVSGKSKLTVATECYGNPSMPYLDIVQRVLTVDGVSYSNKSSDTDVSMNTNTLNGYGTVAVKLQATDTRGLKSTVTTQNITVYRWFTPQINSIDIDVSGTTVSVTVKGKVASVNSKNQKLITIKRKKVSTGATTTIVTDAVLSAYNYTYSFTETISDVKTQSYEYTVTVKDSATSTTKSKSTGVICISRYAGGTGVTFFSEASAPGFNIYGIRHDITEAQYQGLAKRLAYPYNENSLIYTGMFCIHSSKIYEANTASSGEAWNADHWDYVCDV